MRHSLVIGLTLLLPAAAPGADRPIPQDAARMEKRARDRLEWHRKTLQGAYDKIGKKDPRWDKPARQALDLAARMFAQQFDPILHPRDIHIPAKQAVDAGCDDPLIVYLYARTSLGKDFPGQADYDKRMQAAAAAMSASRYSPYRKAVAEEVALAGPTWRPGLTDQERRELQKKLDAVLDLLPRSVAEDPRNEEWEDAWYREINAIIAAHRQLGGDYRGAFDRVDSRLARVRGIEALRLTVKGNFLLQWGWEARTQRFAAAVTEDQFRKFGDRVQQARVALIAAWKANPGQPQVAPLMLAVEKSIGGGDRDAMETWFERAMIADGNDQGACWSKLDWLDPKWYGGDSPDEMMAFGKACAATRNWHNGITLLAADAHLRFGSRLNAADRAKYMSSPEVWSEIKAVYDEYLKHYPDDDVQRSKYAMLCYVGGHYAEAHEQFQAVGDRLTTWPTFPNMPLEYMKQARDQTARVAGGGLL